MNQPLVEVRSLTKTFGDERSRFSRWLGAKRSTVHALHDVDLTIQQGEVVGLVGESGSGKSTLGRLILRLIAPTSGQIKFDGLDISRLEQSKLRPLRRQMQMVFQDPIGSLNPRMNVGDAVGEALQVHGLAKPGEQPERVAALLERVGLSAQDMARRPRSFSGGQRQRIAIARALAVEPRLLVADEPVSALDVSVQAGIINLLRDLQRELTLAMLFISHDLAVINAIANRVMVLYLGRVMEVGGVDAVMRSPRHPYTAALLATAPRIASGKRYNRPVLKGEIASAHNLPSGCVFRNRCPHAIADCARYSPALQEISPGHFKACLRDDVPAVSEHA
jgi:oligopeptide/dipeptide ABC transporter ATP-binding protein